MKPWQALALGITVLLGTVIIFGVVEHAEMVRCEEIVHSMPGWGFAINPRGGAIVTDPNGHRWEVQTVERDYLVVRDSFGMRRTVP